MQIFALVGVVLVGLLTSAAHAEEKKYAPLDDSQTSNLKFEKVGDSVPLALIKSEDVDLSALPTLCATQACLFTFIHIGSLDKGMLVLSTVSVVPNGTKHGYKAFNQHPNAFRTMVVSTVEEFHQLIREEIED